MRKSVALIIALVVLVGISLVSFFGTLPPNIYPPVYIQSIELLDMYSKPIPETNGTKILNLNFKADLIDPETNTEYMQYFFTVDLNKGLEEPTNEDVLYVFGVQNDPADGKPLVEPANGNYSTGAILMKKRNNIVNPVDYFYSLNVTVESNDGGPKVSDSCLLVVNYGYKG